MTAQCHRAMRKVTQKYVITLRYGPISARRRAPLGGPARRVARSNAWCAALTDLDAGRLDANTTRPRRSPECPQGARNIVSDISMPLIATTMPGNLSMHERPMEPVLAAYRMSGSVDPIAFNRVVTSWADASIAKKDDSPITRRPHGSPATAVGALGSP